MVAKLKELRWIGCGGTADIHQDVETDIHVGGAGPSNGEGLGGRPGSCGLFCWRGRGGGGGGSLIRRPKLGRELIRELFLFGLGGFFLTQLVEFFRQRFDLLPLFVLSALKILAHLTQLLFELIDFVGVLGNEVAAGDGQRGGGWGNLKD